MFCCQYYHVWEHLDQETSRSDQETSPTNPQQQHYRIPNAPKRGIILATEYNKQDLAIQEALLIKQHGPKINRQTEDFNNTLKIV